MKECRHCKSEIHEEAKTCPFCRKSQENQAFKAFRITLGIILIFIGLFGFNNFLKLFEGFS